MSMRGILRRMRRRQKFTLRNRILYWTRLYEWIFNGGRGNKVDDMTRYHWIREQARETLHEPIWNLPHR